MTQWHGWWKMTPFFFAHNMLQANHTPVTRNFFRNWRMKSKSSNKKLQLSLNRSFSLKKTLLRLNPQFVEWPQQLRTLNKNVITMHNSKLYHHILGKKSVKMFSSWRYNCTTLIKPTLCQIYINNTKMSHARWTSTFTVQP